MPDELALSMPETDSRGLPRPAVSATADLAPPKTETKPVEGDAPKVEAQGDEPKKKTPQEIAFEREITKQRNKRRAAESQVADLSKQVAALAEAVKNAATKPPVETKPPEDPKPARPRREQFENPQAYDAAMEQHETNLVEWAARQAAGKAKVEVTRETQEAEAKRKKEETAAAIAERAKQIQQEWSAKRDAALEKYPDYEEIAEDDDLLITDVAAHAIMAADNGPEIAYHLGKNPDEAARIAKLFPAQQMVEIGKLSAKLDTPPKTSKAPSPIKPIGATNAASPRTLRDIGDDPAGMEEYAAQRQKQIQTERRARMGLSGNA